MWWFRHTILLSQLFPLSFCSAVTFRYLCYLSWLLNNHLLNHTFIFCILSYLPTHTLQDILHPYIHHMKHSALPSYIISTEKAGLIALLICNGGNDDIPSPSSASFSWPKNMWVNVQLIMSSVLCPTAEIWSWLLGSLGCGSNISGTTRAKSIFSYTQLVQLDIEAQVIPEWPYSLNPAGLPMSYLSLQYPVSLIFILFSCIKHKYEVVAQK